ncbi:uncharacterized protein N7496_005934 [Penicillium cataractarum]|uniref:Uncharacterized protein n=1 Tax=Penicillium cataractarum TaxID=2100454 RepID=A0A9W9S191_9EURO|nr:uncharacterized protein N7496_005934 [Penicillium cataractarum]KAJ5369842.1 hypothetical protein N7496_005934 [Penicillium cataractarum]
MLEGLKTAVERLNTPAFARLLALIPPSSQRPESTGSGDSHLKDGYDEDEHCNASDPESKNSELEVPEREEESNSDNEYQSDEKYDGDCSSQSRNDSEHMAWAHATEVLVPHAKGDSDFVLDALSGNIFENLTRSWGELVGNLNVPDIESRVQHISSNARGSTVHELEQTLVEAGYFVPRREAPSVWPPSIYSPDDDDECAGIVNESVLQDFLKW